VKYDAGSVKGFAPPTGNGIAHYTFEETSTLGSSKGLDLQPKL
jgi:hypothetical protein